VVSIGDVAVAEGDAGNVAAPLEVSLSAPSGKTVTVQYATVNGTALAGLDYVAAGGSLTFPPGVTLLVLPVQVKGDRLPEPDETFFVMLSNPGNAALGDAQGQGTIRDDDAGQSFYTVTPCRLVDTRGADGPALAAGESRAFLVGGPCAVPTSAKAISVNITVTGATAPGNLGLYPGGAAPPSASAINYGAGQTRANNAIIAVGASADLIVKCNQGTGNTHFILDVNGYFR
jgi:large repetitive protein